MRRSRHNRNYDYGKLAYASGKALGSYMKWDPGFKVARATAKWAYPVASTKNTGVATPVRAKTAKPRRKKRKPKGKTARKIKRCQTAIRSLKQSTDASLGTLTHRIRLTGRDSCVINGQGVFDVGAFGTSNMDVSLTKCKFFDPSNPGTLIEANAGDGTYQRNYLFKSITTSCLFRNNNQTDLKIKVYLCSAKDDTDQTPSAAYVAGVANGTNLTSVSSLSQYPTDYDIFNDLWKSKVVLNTTLSPGQSATASHTVNNVEYDPATEDTHSLEFQNEYKAYSFLVVIEGTLAHGQLSPSTVGLQSGTIDYDIKQTSIVQYQAGTNIKFTNVTNIFGAITSAGEQAHQPISQLQVPA